jgi:hypothetical protein
VTEGDDDEVVIGGNVSTASTPLLLQGTCEKLADVGEKAVAAERLSDEGAGDGE